MMYQHEGGNNFGSSNSRLFSRRRFLQGTGGVVFLAFGGGTLAGCGEESEDQSGTSGTQGTPERGGILPVAINADPETLDWHATTATITRTVGWHIFELLFSFDEDFIARPMLAESYDVSEDQRTYTINLRGGVSFHDGSAMAAEDVVASLERWGTLSGNGQSTFENIEDVRAIDESTVEIALNGVYAPLINNLAHVSEAAIVIPAEIAEAAGEELLTDDQFIGTGPYQFVSWERGRQIRLERFEEYAAREEEDWGGFAGKKIAYLDELDFNIVTSPSVRLSGLQTGQHMYANLLNRDFYPQLQSAAEIEPALLSPGSQLWLFPNKARPPFDDVSLRRAVNLAIDVQEVAKGAYGVEELYELDGSLFFPKQEELHTVEGTEPYGEYDPEKARQLIEEAGYDGEPLRFLATRDYPEFYNGAQVIARQLKEVGFNVDLQVLEWPTVLEVRENKDEWDLFITFYGGFAPDISTFTFISPSYPGWYESARMDSFLERWVKATEPAQKERLLVEFHEIVYEEFPIIKIANAALLDGVSTDLVGYESWADMRLWNTGLASPTTS